MQLDDAGLARIEGGEPFEHVVQIEDIHRRRRHDRGHVFEFDLDRAAPALLPAPAAGVIDEHPPHGARGYGHEVRLVLPRDVGIDQAQVGFVYERARLQRVIRPLRPERSSGDAGQFVVDERQQPVESGGFTASPRMEQYRRAWWFHGPDPLGEAG